MISTLSVCVCILWPLSLLVTKIPGTENLKEGMRFMARELWSVVSSSIAFGFMEKQSRIVAGQGWNKAGKSQKKWPTLNDPLPVSRSHLLMPSDFHSNGLTHWLESQPCSPPHHPSLVPPLNTDALTTGLFTLKPFRAMSPLSYNTSLGLGLLICKWCLAHSL